MYHTKVTRRIVSSFLALGLALGTLLPVSATAEATPFPAAFEREPSALLVNADFDQEANFDTGSIAVGKWFVYQGQVVENSATAHSGAKAVLLNNAGSAVDQRVELKPNTEYELKAWVKADNGKGARVRAFINGGEPKMLVDTDANCFGQYYQYTNRFTTPADTTFATVGVVRASGSLAADGNVYVDDFSIEEVNAPTSVSRTDATTIAVTYDKFFEIEASGTSQSVAVYNNIFYREGQTYSFRSNEVSKFNSAGALAATNIVEEGGGTRFANNLFYNFDTSQINQSSPFYTDNLWNVDPLLTDPGTLGDGNASELIAGNIESAWALSVYSLMDNSPAIDAGRPVRDIYAGLKDILGNSVDLATPDLGCIQKTA